MAARRAFEIAIKADVIRKLKFDFAIWTGDFHNQYLLVLYAAMDMAPMMHVMLDVIIVQISKTE